MKTQSLLLIEHCAGNHEGCKDTELLGHCPPRDSSSVFHWMLHLIRKEETCCE